MPTKISIALVLGASVMLAAPVSAYVVVTRGNTVYDVPTRPEVEGQMVFFTLDGVPVSLRVYDVNVPKTNELNYLIDQGASPATIARQLRFMPPAPLEDTRLIVSHPLQSKAITEARPGTPDYRLLRPEGLGPRTSFGDSPGPIAVPPERTRWPAQPRTSFPDAPGRPSVMDDPYAESRLAEEARRVYDEAARDPRRGDYPPAPPMPTTAQPRMVVPAGELAEIDAEIDAEQAYLRRLTSGEVVVDDLDREIDRSMEKIRRLQRQRDRLADAVGEPMVSSEPPGYEPVAPYRPSGRYAAGSREAKWEAQLAEHRERLAFYQQQAAALPPGSSSDREIVDERIGELRWKIQRLERKLQRAQQR